MVRLILLLCLTSLAWGGIIHGIVIERASSRPLSRTRVQLQAVTAGGGRQKVAEAVTNRSGQFWFPSLPDGSYALLATRRGFVDWSYGQQRVNGPATAIVVQGDAANFAEIQLPHLGAVNGRLVDENQVGLGEVSVHAYAATLPLRIVSTAKSDDRGNFRVSGLAPGKYWIRSGPAELEDGSGVLPTFFPGVTAANEARVFTAEPELEIPDVSFQPLPGRVFKIVGKVIGCPPGESSVKITLSSDTGRKETIVPCLAQSYSFDQNAPARYELLAQPASLHNTVAAFLPLAIDRETDSVNLAMTAIPDLELRVSGQKNASRALARRVDPAGVTHSSTGGKVLPGHWEVYVMPTADSAFKSFRVSPFRASRAEQDDSSVAPRILVDNSALVVFDASLGRGATITGVVLSEGRPIGNVPVILFAPAFDVRKLIHGTPRTQTDSAGRFQFGSLPAGEYLLLSTYEIFDVSKDSMLSAGARSVTIAEGQRVTSSLDLQQAR